MVHGGAWKVGDKRAASVVDNKVRRWVTRGFILVSVNYRMLPEANPLEQAQDVARALAYVQQHAADFHGDPARVVLMGHSAGAHLVSLISAHPDLAAKQGAKPWLGTVSLDSAAFDVVDIMQRFQHFKFYDEAFGQVTSARCWKSGSRPIMLLHATRAAHSRRLLLAPGRLDKTGRTIRRPCPADRVVRDSACGRSDSW